MSRQYFSFKNGDIISTTDQSILPEDIEKAYKYYEETKHVLCMSFVSYLGAGSEEEFELIKPIKLEI